LSEDKKEHQLQRQVARIREALAKVQSEQTRAKTRDENYKHKQLSVNRNVMIFTGLLVATSTIAGIIGIWQGCSNQTSAKATSDSSNTASRSLILDQRPWLYVDNVELPVEPQLSVPFFFHTWMSNAGKTPGTDVLITEQTKWWNSEPEFPDFSNMPEPKPAQLVMPGMDKYEANSTPATMDKFPYISAYEQTRESRLYLLMKISYCDGFGNRYWTTMCISHGYGTKPKDMKYCAHGNAVGQDTQYKNCPSILTNLR
jgi:hypothetical protein